MGGGSGIEAEHGCGAGKTSGGVTFGYDVTIYTDNHDFSAFNQLRDPRFFPKTGSGFNCQTSENGSMICDRSTAAAPMTGKEGASVGQLRDYAYRGDVVSFREDDTIDCSASGAYDGRSCFMVSFNFPHYMAEAMYTYNPSTGELNRPVITWMNESGKIIGHSRQFLSNGDAPTEFTSPGAMEVTSFAAPGRAAAIGSDVTYAATVTATKDGAALVDFKVEGLSDASEAVVPTDWVRYSSMDSSVIRYLVPYLRAGDSQSLSLHFKAAADIGVVTATVNAENSATSEVAVNVVPAAPSCTVPEGGAIVQKGGEATALAGAICTAAPGTTLTTLYDPATAGDLSVALQRDSSTVYQLSYKAHTADYVGSESINVYAINNANGEYSDPSPVAVKVVGPAVAVADEYSVVTGTTLQADDATGITANDQFGMGREGWSVQQGYGPAHGALRLNPSGSFQYTPVAGYVGDDSFRYRLSGPNGANSQVVTVTFHVTAG